MNMSNSGSRFGDLRKIYSSHEWRKKGTNLYDPSYHVSVWLAFPILQRQLDTVEFSIVHQNILKHMFVVRAVAIVLILAVWQMNGLSRDDATLVVMTIVPLVIVTGTAWFTIAVGAVRQSLLPAILDMTKWLFLAFVSSIVIALVAAGQVLPIFITFMLAFAGFALVFSALLYDYVDSLTLGSDDHARAFYLSSLLAIQKSGGTIIETSDQYRTASRDGDDTSTSEGTS